MQHVLLFGGPSVITRMNEYGPGAVTPRDRNDIAAASKPQPSPMCMVMHDGDIAGEREAAR